KPFKTKELSAQINTSRLSFASPEHMEKYLDILPGAVSAAGLMNDAEQAVNLLVDEDLLKSEDIVIHPCVNTSSVMLKTADLLDKFVPYTKHSYKTVKLVGE
ncbi:MAG: prolyl-tRNA synthetase associated domain-containing protein, partial [Clostridia bacterium]|nr:prolyl-tRNA synthetase associated domain-containing protein [Clostridia bacterium]